MKLIPKNLQDDYKKLVDGLIDDFKIHEATQSKLKKIAKKAENGDEHSCLIMVMIYHAYQRGYKEGSYKVAGMLGVKE